MRSAILVARQEFKLLWRDRTFQLLGMFVLLLSIYTIAVSSAGYTAARNEHRQLTDTLRHLFEHQKPTSAHMAGHYGHVVFKPASFLQAIDEGVNPFTGTTVRMEAHRQNEAVFSAASGQSSLVRFGKFSFSLLLQVVLPLLILFTCYRAVAADRQNGTLKVLVSQGGGMRQLITGKIMAYSLVYWAFLLFAALAYALVFSFSKQQSDAAQVLPRIVLLLCLYGVYYFLLIAWSVYLSARARNASGLLVSLLAIWFSFTIIIPKAAINIGSQRAPLPTRFDVNKDIAERKKGGIDGHNSRNERTQRFKDSLLKAYGVDSASQLPVKMGGLLMQADEDFNNQVYDKAMLDISETIARQNSVGSYASFIDPLMSVKNISMAIAGTDMHHHFHFTGDAENYRRHLIRQLNEQDAAKVSAFKDEKGKMKPEFWQRMKDYRYTAPSIVWSAGNCCIELLALLLWVIFTIGVIYTTSQKIKIV